MNSSNIELQFVGITVLLEHVWDLCQVLLLIPSKFNLKVLLLLKANLMVFWCFQGDQKGTLGRNGLSEFIKFYSRWNYQKTYGFLMILGGIKVNWFTQICLILEVKLGGDPLFRSLWIFTTKTAVNIQEKRAYLRINFHSDLESLNNNLLWILLYDFQHEATLNKGTLLFLCLSSLSANPTKWSTILKQFVSSSRRIVWVCLTILWGWRVKCFKNYQRKVLLGPKLRCCY